MKRFRNFWRAREGSTAVEFGIIAAPFFILLFGALQVFIILLTQQMFQTAAEAFASVRRIFQPESAATNPRGFLACERGASAVEFALVGSMLIFSILFAMTVGLIVYFNQALDYATSKAARQIMIGAVQKNGTSQSDFRKKVVCPYLPATFNCDNVIVNVQTATRAAQPSGYYAFVKPDLSGLIIPTLSVDSAQYSVGVQGSYEYLQIVYPITFIPSAFASILGGSASFNGSPAYLVVSTAAFRNEQF